MAGWPSYTTSRQTEQLAAERFTRDVEGHRLTIEVDTAQVTHLSIRNPHNSEYWFEVTATPSSVTVHADMGTFVFASPGRTDQLSLFRSRSVRVDHWAEKVVAGQAKKFHVDEYVAAVVEAAEDHIGFQDDPGFDTDSFREQVSAALLGYLLPEDEHEAYELLEGCDLDGVVFETSDVHVRRPTYHFLWCLHAVQWAVQRYDEARRSPVA